MNISMIGRALAATVLCASVLSCRGADAGGGSGANAAAIRLRADSLARKGEYDLAISKYDSSLALDSTNGRVFNDRGGTYMLKGDYAPAIKDFDRALAINPNHGQALKNRGRTHFMLGHMSEAAADLQKALPFDSTNAYVVLWLHIARRRLGQDDVPQFAVELAKTDTSIWPGPVGSYFLGKLTPVQLRAASTLIDPRVNHDQRCAAAFFLGEDELIHKKNAQAQSLFEEAVATCPKDWTEYHASVGELARLKGPPASTK